MGNSNIAKAEPVDMKIEVVLFGVSDVDRAKAFYENLGWRVDIDIAHGDFRGVQVTPHNSDASIIFGKGITPAQPGSAHNLVLAVDNIDAARDYLIARGVEVSEVFHYAAGPFNNTVENPRVAGRDLEGRSYFSFASFKDPDGNDWLLQEITMRLPGREWESVQRRATDVASLAELLRETAEHTTITRRSTLRMIGGIGTRRTWAHARTAAVRRIQQPPPSATWTRFFTCLRSDLFSRCFALKVADTVCSVSWWFTIPLNDNHQGTEATEIAQRTRRVRDS